MIRQSACHVFRLWFAPFDGVYPELSRMGSGQCFARDFPPKQTGPYRSGAACIVTRTRHFYLTVMALVLEAFLDARYAPGLEISSVAERDSDIAPRLCGE